MAIYIKVVIKGGGGKYDGACATFNGTSDSA